MDDGGTATLLNAPATLMIAGVLAAVLAALLIVAWRRGETIAPMIAVVLVAAAAFALNERLARSDRAAARRALIDRAAALDRAALAPGSPLACLNADAGETVENGCEKAVFASAQSAAAAVAYAAARLQLLAEAAAFGEDPDISAALAASRRAIALDRFGVAAQALATRVGCTASRCPAFALVGDAEVLKANLKAQVFAQYVARYADAWSAPAEKPQAVSAAPAPAAAVDEPKEHRSGAEKFDFPSAASIPPVSIMNPEPPLPAAADESRPAPKPSAPATAPMPPKRPAEAPPAR
ncbi:MAG: hypothetical protein IRY89_13145 [Pseudolabrys sp.]|nr:hypothetical protein [Pseudolabrys sp.]